MALNTRILEADVSFHSQPLVRPLVISSGAISVLTEARARVTVEVHGRRATGAGSIYLSDLWAWPDPALSHDYRDGILRELTLQIATMLPDLTRGESLHPLEIGLRLHERVCHPAPGAPPPLAQAVCLSPFDAAIHDAVGIALERSAFGFYDEPAQIPSADGRFGAGGAVSAIHRMLRTEPRMAIPAWYLVGKQDDLEKDVSPWTLGRGYRCLKIKLMGKDNVEDVARTVEVFQAARWWKLVDPWLSVDTNEANPDAASVLDYLQRLRATDPEAFGALKYLEQPTGRDIRVHRHDWRAVTRLKPVMLDEGLTSLDLLEEAREQGWSGLALKTCKGQSFTLVAGAWAHERGMLLSLQDLTNPGLSAIQAALMAAHLPTINGVELNSPQFTPAANAPWLVSGGHWTGVLAPQDGLHRLPSPIPSGLGSMLN